MSNFHYGLHSKNKGERIDHTFENTQHLNEELDKLRDQFHAAMKLLGITFDVHNEEAFFAKPKEKKEE